MAVLAVLAGAAVGLAGPASAAGLSGTYTATVTEASGSVGPAPISPGQNVTWLLSECGPDCTHSQSPVGKAQVDLHLQGNSWVGGPDELGCNKTISADAATATEVCPMWTIQYTLAKTG
jgi:hypothetical protein